MATIAEGVRSERAATRETISPPAMHPLRAVVTLTPRLTNLSAT
jgi:hypothetical protein